MVATATKSTTLTKDQFSFLEDVFYEFTQPDGTAKQFTVSDFRIHYPYLTTDAITKRLKRLWEKGYVVGTGRGKGANRRYTWRISARGKQVFA